MCCPFKIDQCAVVQFGEGQSTSPYNHDNELKSVLALLLSGYTEVRPHKKIMDRFDKATDSLGWSLRFHTILYSMQQTVQFQNEFALLSSGNNSLGLMVTPFIPRKRHAGSLRPYHGQHQCLHWCGSCIGTAVERRNQVTTLAVCPMIIAWRLQLPVDNRCRLVLPYHSPYNMQ